MRWTVVLVALSICTSTSTGCSVDYSALMGSAVAQSDGGGAHEGGSGGGGGTDGGTAADVMMGPETQPGADGKVDVQMADGGVEGGGSADALSGTEPGPDGGGAESSPPDAMGDVWNTTMVTCDLYTSVGCPAGTKCTWDNRVGCFSWCGPIGPKKVDEPCAYDSDCGAGLHCSLTYGVCNPWCRSNSDCKPTSFCNNGFFCGVPSMGYPATRQCN